MNIRSIIHYGHGAWSVAICAALLSLAGCRQDELVSVVPDKDMLNFQVGVADEWNFGNAGTAADSTGGHQKTGKRLPKAAITTVQAFSSNGAPEAKPLYLHTSVTDAIESAPSGGAKAQKRGTPVDETADFYESFGIFGYLTDEWDGTVAPEYFCNTEVTEGSDEYWIPTEQYYWPGGGQSLCVWAYAPYNAPALGLPTLDGEQHFTYTVPEKAEEQQDLLIAEPEIGSQQNGILTLTFKHVLTAVKFVTADDIRPGSISKISLKSVHNQGTYTRGATDWTLTDDIQDEFSYTFTPEEKEVDGSGNVQILPEEATFMMLPQTLPDDATIEVEFTDRKSNFTYTLTANIGGKEWPMGHTVTYRISMSSISEKHFFDIDSIGAFTYAGGDSTFNITSYTIVSKEGVEPQIVKEPWEVVECQYNYEEEHATDNDWFTITENGGGSTSEEGEPVTATVKKRNSIRTNEYNKRLKENGTLSGTTDLSQSNGGTANCYIVNAAGDYSLPLVYGNALGNENAYKSKATGDHVLQTFTNHLGNAITDAYIYNNAGCTPKKAGLVWQDVEGLVKDVSLDKEGHNLQFNVDAGRIEQGNAVVAVYDANDQVMWS